LQWDVKGAAVSPFVTVGFLCLGKLDQQLFRLDLDARNVGVDKAAIVHRRQWFEMAPELTS
jgi:hypothetical protein